MASGSYYYVKLFRTLQPRQGRFIQQVYPYRTSATLRMGGVAVVSTALHAYLGETYLSITVQYGNTARQTDRALRPQVEFTVEP